MPTTSQDLLNFVKKNIGDKKFIVAFHREPFTHIKTPTGVKLQKNAAGGGIELLMGILKQIGGTMVSVATGDADKETVDTQNRIEMKTDKKSYTLKRIFLSKKVFNGFYLGFANQVLWPLCHAVFVKPIYNPEWWYDYIKVNEKFCDAILEEVGNEDAFIWINDYQLALLPEMLHKKKPSLAIGTFWHIPWPAYALFRTLPWRKEILNGLLGSDFISFHRDYMVENFIDCLRREVGVIVDSEPKTIKRDGHDTKLINLPAGIDDDEIQSILKKNKNHAKEIIKNDFGVSHYKYMAIGVDRIDYTKGLLERVQIIDKFLELHPAFKGEFVYLSVAPMSRIEIPAYKQYYKDLFDLINKVNAKYETKDWKPLHFVDKTLPRERLFTYYQNADVCMLTPLDDGMNLVAKEYMVSCKTNKGMLVLSKFIGAAKDLNQAVLINPYDIEGSAGALYQALTMPEEEKIRRNQMMKDTLKENNIYNWGIKFIQNTLKFNEDELEHSN